MIVEVHGAPSEETLNETITARCGIPCLVSREEGDVCYVTVQDQEAARLVFDAISQNPAAFGSASVRAVLRGGPEGAEPPPPPRRRQERPPAEMRRPPRTAPPVAPPPP